MRVLVTYYKNDRTGSSMIFSKSNIQILCYYFIPYHSYCFSDSNFAWFLCVFPTNKRTGRLMEYLTKLELTYFIIQLFHVTTIVLLVPEIYLSPIIPWKLN